MTWHKTTALHYHRHYAIEQRMWPLNNYRVIHEHTLVHLHKPNPGEIWWRLMPHGLWS